MKIFAKFMGGVGVVLLCLMLYATYLEWNVKRWDAKIDALCAANGGKDVATRVYETAMAPETPEYFAETQPTRTFKIPERRDGQALGPGYPYVVETRVVQVLKESDPGVVKYRSRVVRVADGTTLSERSGYQRSGGGIPLWDPDEIRNCPKVSTENRLDIKTFRNHPSHGQSEK